jgi:hypothetical protein
MDFKENLYLLPKYFISEYFLMAGTTTILWLYLRKSLPRKRPQKLSIINKFLIHLPILVVLAYISQSI